MAAGRKAYLILEYFSTLPNGLFAGVGIWDGGSPVRVLHDHKKAVGVARRLEGEARKVLPPFHAGRPKSWSSMGLPGLIERLNELGLRDLPDPDLDNNTE